MFYLPVLPLFLPVLEKLFSFGFKEFERYVSQPFKQKNKLSLDFFTKIFKTSLPPYP